MVRQTVSKWEQGLSVPDSDLLIALSEALETPVSTLLGETIVETDADRLTAISEKLEVINLQLAQIKCSRRKVIHWLFIAFSAAVVAMLALLLLLNSPYQHWDYSDPETAVLGTIYHSLEWLFAPGVALPPGGGSYRRCFDTEAKLTMLGKEAVEPLPLSAPS